jgi:prolipoprotein diacylglyceryltransferase
MLLAVLLVVYRLNQKKKNVGTGMFFGVYLVGYGVIRFLLEFLKLEKWEIGGVAAAQIMAILFIAIGWFMIRIRIARR